MKKTVFRILVLVMAAAVAFTVVHFAVLGNNSPTDTAFTFAIEDGNAILTGSDDSLSGAVLLPETIGGYTVVGIGDNAFKDCEDVTAFFLPDTITSIGAYAFENCTGLAQAILPDGLVSIGEGAFWKCNSLVSVTVPASVTNIGSCAFYKCDALESLVVPGTSTPVRGIFNVALDIGQTLAVGNPAQYTLDPITTTVYCYDRSVAYYDVIQDAFCTYDLLRDASENDAGNLTSYTIRYTDTADVDVAPPVTLNVQPVGIHVAAVATIVDDEELVYPDPAIQTIELTDTATDNTITFVYTARTYTITFDADEGVEKDPLVYTTTDEAVLGETTRHGYSLVGWQVAEPSADAHYNWGDTDTVYQTTDAVTGKYGDVTLKAVWQANSVTVTFDAQGGTADPADALVTFGETYGELAVATREGYSFAGWYTEDGVMIESSTTVTAVEDHTLYASWTINKYDVTVTTDGNGTASSDLTADIEYGTRVTLTAEPNPGYTFLAWESDDVSIADNAFTMPDKAVTVNATFTAIEYTISFDTDGGDAKADLTYKITDETKLGSASKNGYTFIRWRLLTGDGNWTTSAYSPEFSVNGKYGNIALQAVWKANSITVTYDAQGGTPSAASKNVTVGGTYGTLAGATREGYSFDGWYTAPDGGTKIEPSTTVTALESHTIYAYWTINKYNVTVTSDNNGFVTADQTQDVVYGTLVTLSATAKPGYTFAAWVSNDVNVENDTFTMPDKPVRVQGTFAPVSYTVTFDTDGGDAKTALTYNTTDETALGGATKDGYTLTCWQVSVPAAEGDYNWGNTQKTYSSEQTVRGKYGDVTLKAIWEGNDIVVFYDGMGGAANAENKTVKVGGTYGTLADAVFEGYTFDGWYTEDGTKITADTPVTQTAGHTLYAHWTINKYDVTVTNDGHGTASADLTADVEYGTLVTLTAEANTGYTFLAWASDDVTIAENSFDMPDKAVTVQATFAPIRYTIAFDPNSGENEMEPIDATYDVDVELPACTFEKNGFAFLGWALSANAAEPEIEDGDTVKNLTATADETVTLYAVWKDIKVEVTTLDGSSAVIDNERGYIYGLAFDLTENDIRNDYLSVIGNGHLEFSNSNIGTGTYVYLVNDNTGNVDATYQIVIFGDLTGDGILNGNDITFIRNANAHLIEFAPDTIEYFAADVTHDGIVNANDVKDIRSAYAHLTEMSQTF